MSKEKTIYNHDSDDINEATGINIGETIHKAAELIKALPEEHATIVSRKIEMFETNFTKAELALLIVMITEKAISALTSGGLGSLLAPEEDICDCPACKLRRSMSAPTMPISKGGDA